QLPLVARAGPGAFLGVLWALAYVEELLWDRGVWHERAWLFGHGWDVGTLKLVLVPLLAVPQITHYVLDGFVWRRRQNPTFSLIPPSNFCRGAQAAAGPPRRPAIRALGRWHGA